MDRNDLQIQLKFKVSIDTLSQIPPLSQSFELFLNNVHCFIISICYLCSFYISLVLLRSVYLFPRDSSHPPPPLPRDLAPRGQIPRDLALAARPPLGISLPPHPLPPNDTVQRIFLYLDLATKKTSELWFKNYICFKDKFCIVDWKIISLKKIKIIAYRQEPSNKILTHSRSQESVLIGSLLRYYIYKRML